MSRGTLLMLVVLAFMAGLGWVLLSGQPLWVAAGVVAVCGVLGLFSSRVGIGREQA